MSHPHRVITGPATATAYVAGLVVGYLTRHPAPVAVLALALTVAHTRAHRPRRSTAPGRTTA
ncbi:hypothetical protein Acy02nite_22170 [Actinoplanes cyaneus]|uniref:Uncharacterized protein n=1 Tax=Actinoplanes cyaneus TaxID=52696 RepID=A0A919IFP7_9ACTN|nr:hypothetical protein [Actinoplanes cyaneus]MCW2136518.1 hypothetical protein [Actinoplanes cyaneus]GID64336.1 hypothetical protein Acy02nite_22170 [Actinoplanes cyaneus]